MIVTTDIANILFVECKKLEIQVVPMGQTVTGELKGERITIHTKSQQDGTYWKKGFVEVNICVPDLRSGEANTIRLSEVERQAVSTLGDVVGEHDGSAYRYSISQIGIEKDTDLRCHYVNVKLLFQVLNC